LNRSRDRGEAFNLVLTHYAIERFLYRLTQTAHSEQFILKGAMLFAIWSDKPCRPTQDVDLLGPANTSPDALAEICREICAADVEPDGITFDPDSIRADEIREEQAYQGLRVKLMGCLGKARVPLQVDVGFGDAVTPTPQYVTFGPLLDLPAPVLKAYPPDTMVAEKLETMVRRGMPNNRMRDYYDLWWMCRFMTFDGSTLADAIRATFERRRTPLPVDLPIGLSNEFASHPLKAPQWSSFVRKSGVENAPSLPQVLDLLRRFAAPLLNTAAQPASFPKKWASGEWR
jgi:hypothetical protein